MLQIMSSLKNTEAPIFSHGKEKWTRTHSAQRLGAVVTCPAIKIPLPPQMWLTDLEDESSDDIVGSVREDGGLSVERTKVRSRYRHQKQRAVHYPIGIFWDIENCQVPRGCSAIDVVSAIRAKFLPGKREADFVVVCDVRKESVFRLQELNDAQVSLIHVCGTQKNAADEKLRQCMRRFSELHKCPASLLLISGDINFAADLSDFRHRKNMEVILVHKQNTSSALITCASSHYCYNEITADLPRNLKRLSQSNEEDEEATCVLEVMNLPADQSPERVSRRLRRLADNCGGKVIQVTSTTALLKFQTLNQSSRALKRMDGEDVFGCKISTRYARSVLQPTYSSDEGYSTATAVVPAQRMPLPPFSQQAPLLSQTFDNMEVATASGEWARALKLLPSPTPAPLQFCPPPAPKPRKIRGTHGSIGLDRSGCSSSNSGDDCRHRDGGRTRAPSPWNSSASTSEQSDGEFDTPAELTVTNLPPQDPALLQDMLIKFFREYVPVTRASVWIGSDGPQATIVLRSEADARLAIARIHKRRFQDQWMGRRLELSLGKPSPAPNLDVLRARLRAILLDQENYSMPLVRLRDAYANRHCCALTTADIAKVKDTVIIHESFGRLVQLIDLTPVTSLLMEEAPWKCHLHASLSTGQEDGSRILQLVYIELATLTKNVKKLLESHDGILPLLSFVECYEASFPPFMCDVSQGVNLELLLRSIPDITVKDTPSRHITWRTSTTETSLEHTYHSESSRSSSERERGRTAPVLEPMLSLFERELIDLLRALPRCSIPFSKLIPAYHHCYGRQCRVADLGFTKLPDVLQVLDSIVVLGSGSSRVITLSAAKQARRWTTDLVKLLKASPGRLVSLKELPALYQSMFGHPFNPVNYGMCTLSELMQRVSPQVVIFSPDGSVSLPRRSPTPVERNRTSQFAIQVVELLSFTANLQMEFCRFVPAYHAHYGRQLRVAHYGCVKLVDLFDLIPDTAAICAGPGGERCVRLTATAARPLVAQRLLALAPLSLAALPAKYARHFGAPPLPDVLEAESLEALVYAAGGYVADDVAYAPGQVPQWSTAMLAACAALSADRCVSRGSTSCYVETSCRRLGIGLDLRRLLMAGVVETTGKEHNVRLAGEWRHVWRVAQILEDHAGPLAVTDIVEQYKRSFEPEFPPAQHGLEGVCEFLRRHREIFMETTIGHWALCGEVKVLRSEDLPGVPSCTDYSLFNTPPGQKGSRVFDSPNKDIWRSPPASSLPPPTALIPHEPKRRTRLAAQFDTA